MQEQMKIKRISVGHAIEAECASSLPFRCRRHDVLFCYCCCCLTILMPSTEDDATHRSSFTLCTCLLVCVCVAYTLRILFCPFSSKNVYFVFLIRDDTYDFEIRIRMSVRVTVEGKGSDVRIKKEKRRGQRQRCSDLSFHTSDENKYEFFIMINTIASIVLVSILCLNALLATFNNS